MCDLSSASPELLAVLESAAKLQRVVPDAVLVGGSAAALHARHRTSFDHDHVLPELTERYAAILEAVEATDGWATSVRASKPPMTIMGELGGIEAGLRQLRRTVPLQTERVTLPSRSQVVVPTIEEALRVKAYLVLQRNAVRDYLDVAALADRLGIAAASAVLAALDAYYDDRDPDHESVVTALTERLSLPQPRDTRVLRELSRYKQLDERWHEWGAIVGVCQQLADAIVATPPNDERA
ncbi:MAG: hypothetical protein QM679_12715 [Patulibacter sp.]